MSVIVYSTRTCPYCELAKRFLSSNNIDFEDIDVSSDKNAAEEMMAKSGQMGVPVIDINGRIVVGFDEREIRSLLNI